MLLKRLIQSLPALDLAAIVDILLVAFVVYEILMVVRGTRAGHVLIGMLAMLSIYAVATWAGLEALRSVLSFIVPYIGLAVIVLFQSEIRRTLARIGRKNWFGLGRGFRGPEALSEILLAVDQFSREKIGALIVFERDIGLRTFIESGVVLDAQISRDVLLSIFQPGLPLHDGAVILQKERIAAAACFLPLTISPSLKLGTRHRAAIGITEETDCLSLVVSEETGRISIAAFGELIQGLELPEVEERIQRHFGVNRPTSSEIGEFPADIPLTAGDAVKPPAERTKP
ncbi:MAG TPA: diadenylate cyclase CdaA [Candidatus Acidoferrales bacterium]|nr:diadenylate cyclase CdaA [Candidatus Acidoferrales bacterium]